MRYHKDVQDGFIVAIGTGGGGDEITEAEYQNIMAVIQNKPQRTETTDHHLTVNLEWVEYERIEPSDDDSEASADEILGILLGGSDD